MVFIMNKGDFIRISYIGRLETGEIFDLTDEELAKKEGIFNPKIKYKPVPVIIGAGFVIPGLDKALAGMNTGEKKTVEIQPPDAFGERNMKLVRVVPKKIFKSMNYEPKQGQIVDFSGTKGRIQSVSAGRVMVDFNNPLAGKVLKYELEIKEKIGDNEGRVKAIFEFFGIEKVDTKINEGSLDIETIRLPPEVKDRISSLILEYAKPEGVSRVRFIETFGEKDTEKTNAP